MIFTSKSVNNINGSQKYFVSLIIKVFTEWFNMQKPVSITSPNFLCVVGLTLPCHQPTITVNFRIHSLVMYNDC